MPGAKAELTPLRRRCPTAPLYEAPSVRKPTLQISTLVLYQAPVPPTVIDMGSALTPGASAFFSGVADEAQLFKLDNGTRTFTIADVPVRYRMTIASKTLGLQLLLRPRNGMGTCAGVVPETMTCARSSFGAARSRVAGSNSSTPDQGIRIAAPHRSEAVPSGVTGWPIVGRGRHLSHLTGAVAAKRGAVITGPAGVGKTTLALSRVEWARQHGMAQPPCPVLGPKWVTRRQRRPPLLRVYSQVPPSLSANSSHVRRPSCCLRSPLRPSCLCSPLWSI